MRQRLIAGNWKMHLTPAEAEAYIDQFLRRLPATSAEVVLLPAFPSLDRAGRLLSGSPVHLGAQDVHYEAKGAFTGAVSPAMLVDCGCRYVLVGHSERRHVFGEPDAIVRRKLDAVLTAGLAPILCVGETLGERKAGQTHDVLQTQLDAGLRALAAAHLAKVVVAYEPVWAIGTGETATPDQAQDAAAWIRAWVGRSADARSAETLCILYGGSVKAENARDLLSLTDVDGALVGGASLDPAGFAAIIEAAEA